ncbi:hypothetical protein [Phaffia rhodozyma]|uniref:Sds3-like n=1 Tax=Phaffia rhodozyma TaxID=264483 RepID=A0A0F7SI88_PHARH|nr:hypothetical protein [Phaffia rhodozyma]
MSITTLSNSATMSTPQGLVSNVSSAISALPNILVPSSSPHDSVHPHPHDSLREDLPRSPSPLSSPSRKVRQADIVQVPIRIHPKPFAQNGQQGIRLMFKPERVQTDTGKIHQVSHSDTETASRLDVSDGTDQDSEEEDEDDDEDEDDEDYTEHEYQPTRPMSVSTRKSLAPPGTEPAAAPGETIPAFAPVPTTRKNALPLPRGRANSPRGRLPSPTPSIPSTRQRSRSRSHTLTSPLPVSCSASVDHELSPAIESNSASVLTKRSVPLSEFNIDSFSGSKRTRRISHSPIQPTSAQGPNRRSRSSSPGASVDSSSTSSNNTGPRSTSPVKVDRRRKGNGGGRWPSGAPRSSTVSLNNSGPSLSDGQSEVNQPNGVLDVKMEEQSTELLLNVGKPKTLVDGAQNDEGKEYVSELRTNAERASIISPIKATDVPSSAPPPPSSESPSSLSKIDSVESSFNPLKRIVPKIVLVQPNSFSDGSHTSTPALLTNGSTKPAPTSVVPSKPKASRETTPAGQPSKKALHAAEMKLLRARKRQERLELVEIELKMLDELYESVANNTDQSLVECWADLQRRYTGASTLIENRKRQAEAELMRVYDADISFTWSWWNISRFDTLNKEKAELSMKLQKLGREHRQIQTAALPPSERFLPVGSRAPLVPNPRYVVHTPEYRLSNDNLEKQEKKRKKRRLVEPESSDDESIGVKGLRPDDIESDLNKLGLGRAEKEKERLRLIGARQEEERMKREEEERIRAQLEWEAKEAKEAERKLEEQEWERQRAMSVLEAQRLEAEKREQDAVDYRSNRDSGSYPLPMAKPSRTRDPSGKPKSKAGKSTSTSKPPSRSAGMPAPPPPSAPTLPSSSSSSSDIRPIRPVKMEPSSGPIFPSNAPLSPVIPPSAHPWNDPHSREPASYYLGGGSSHLPYPSPHYGPSSYPNMSLPGGYPQHFFPSPLNWIPGQSANQESTHQSVGPQGGSSGSSGSSRNVTLSTQDHPSVHPFHLNPYVSFSSMGDNRSLLSHVPQQQQQQQRPNQHPYQHQPYQSQHQQQQPYSISPSHHEHILSTQSHPHHHHVAHRHHQQPSHTPSGSQSGLLVDPPHRPLSTSVSSSTTWRPAGGSKPIEPVRSNYLPHSFLNPLPSVPPNQAHHPHASQQQQLPPLPFGSSNHQLHPLTGPGHPLWGTNYGVGNSR